MIGPFNREHFNPNHFACGHIASGDTLLGGRKPSEQVIPNVFYPQVNSTITADISGSIMKPFTLESNIQGIILKKNVLQVDMSVPIHLPASVEFYMIRKASLQADITVPITPLEDTKLMKILKVSGILPYLLDEIND